MPAAMIQKMYIDYEWEAKKYLCHSREKLLDIETTKDTLKCFNLERIIEADFHGMVKPAELTMADLLGESSEVEDKS